MSQKKYFILLLFLFISFINILSFEQNENDLNQKYTYKQNNKKNIILVQEMKKLILEIQNYS